MARIGRLVITITAVWFVINGILLVVVWRDYGVLSHLQVSFFDVGQGDGMLLRTPYGHDVLIDAGPTGSIVNKLGATLPWYNRDLELVIITHPHADHYRGLFEVLKRYEIKKVIVPDVTTTSSLYQKLITQLQEQHIPVIRLKYPIRLRMGHDLTLDLLFPDHPLGTIKSMNDASLTGMLTFKHSRILLPGDLEAKGENYLIKKQAHLKADVLKVGHHGSKTSTTEAWLSAIDPDYAIISVGAKNSYGHPHPSVVERLQEHDVTTYRTDVQGDITLTSDGDKITLTSQK